MDATVKVTGSGFENLVHLNVWFGGKLVHDETVRPRAATAYIARLEEREDIDTVTVHISDIAQSRIDHALTDR